MSICISFFSSPQDALEVCQTRVSKLELQQQQQQVVQLESADAKVLLGKCINIMLAIVTVILVCVSTAAKFSAPLMRSRLHMFGTFVCVCLLVYSWSNWEHLQCAIERMLLPRWGTWNMRLHARSVMFLSDKVLLLGYSLYNVTVPRWWLYHFLFFFFGLLCLCERVFMMYCRTGPSL